MTDTIKARSCAVPEWPPADDAELQAWSKERQQEYEIGELLDRELGLETPEEGRALLMAAERDLKSRGLAPASATYEQMRDAMLRVSP